MYVSRKLWFYWFWTSYFSEFDEDGNIPGHTKDSTSVNMDGIMQSHEQKRTTGSTTTLGMEHDELDTDDDKAEVRGMLTRTGKWPNKVTVVSAFTHLLVLLCLVFVLQLLSNEKSKNAPFWTFEYYQTFFSVDTQEVSSPMKACARIVQQSMYSTARAPFDM